MKRILLGVAALFTVGAAPVLAADLPARAYTKAPPPVAAPLYNWTGFYIGANGGYGWGRTNWLFTAVGTTANHNPSGGLAGGQIGYNWQWTNWVFGVEADGDWANIRGSTPCPNPAFTCFSNTRDLATFRGRIGYAAGPALFYGTGGAAYANSYYSALLPGGVPTAGTPGVFSTDRWGYAAGAGIEYGFTPNWSAKLEYMHYGFNTVTTAPFVLGASPAALRLNIDTLKVGINYRFGGPIVARY